MNTVTSKVVLVNAETNVTTQETNPVGADAIMWTPPICQEDDGDWLFADETPTPKRVVARVASPVMRAPADERAGMSAGLESMRIVTGRPAECALADQ